MWQSPETIVIDIRRRFTWPTEKWALHFTLERFCHSGQSAKGFGKQGRNGRFCALFFFLATHIYIHMYIKIYIWVCTYLHTYVCACGQTLSLIDLCMQMHYEEKSKSSRTRIRGFKKTTRRAAAQHEDCIGFFIFSTEDFCYIYPEFN